MTEAVTYVAARPLQIRLRDPDDPSKPLISRSTREPIVEIREKGEPVPEALHLENFRVLERAGLLVPAELWEDGRGRVRYVRARHRRGNQRRRFGAIPPPPPDPRPEPAEVEPEPVAVEPVEVEPEPEKPRRRPRKRTKPKDE